MRKFICRSEAGLARAAEIIAAMPVGKKPWLIEVKQYTPNLSDEQRGLYRLWVREIALSTGNDEGVVHEFLADKFMPKVEVMVGAERRLVRKSTGKNKNAADHDVMAVYMTQVEAWAALELGLALPAKEVEDKG